MNKWKCKDLGPVKTFVGFQIHRDRANQTIFINQESYVRKLLERTGMKNCNGVSNPLDCGTVLRESADDKLLDAENSALYRQIVGSVIYLSNNTRPDISYAVGQLARFMSKPRLSFLNHSKHLLRYLQRTMNFGITYSPRNDDPRTRYKLNSFDIYTDATWGTEDYRKSFQGYSVVYNGGVISWASQLQKSTALSSMEAEIIAANEGAKEAAWMEKLWHDLHQEKFVPTLWCDNQAAIEFCKDSGKFHSKAKHIEIRYFYVRNDMTAMGRLKVEKIAGTDNPADIFTKQLSHEPLKKHMKTMGIGNQPCNKF
ncbi:hypothetical protein K3495_g7878 [Podosphaera aphanis]|nr:hypothetical protein K3495_g7878 [Podosphaera aphanis]